MNTGESAPRGTLGTVHNAALLLELLSEGPSHHQLTDLAERSGMSLPTLHRLLRSLLAAGLVEQDPRSARYGLGSTLALLAERYRARLPVLAAAGPYLVQLRDTTKGTVVVAIRVRDLVVHVDRVDGEDAGGVFRDASRVGPARDSAAGCVLLAHADDATWARYVGDANLREQWSGEVVVRGAAWPTPPAPPASAGAPAGSAPLDGPAGAPAGSAPPGGPARAPAEAAAASPGPTGASAGSAAPPPPGLAGGPVEIAAPIRDRDGQVVAALAVSRAAADDLAREVAPQLLRAATSISRGLGHV